MSSNYKANKSFEASLPKNDPFEMFDKNIYNEVRQDQQKKKLLEEFTNRKEKRLLQRIFEDKPDHHRIRRQPNNINRLKALEALTDKQRDNDNILYSAVENNPNMDVMNKFLKMGLLKDKDKDKDSLPKKENVFKKSGRPNPFKLSEKRSEADENLEPKSFDDIKEFYYINLFEGDGFNAEDLVNKKRAEIKALIIQCGQRMLEEESIRARLNNYKIATHLKPDLTEKATFYKYIIGHTIQRIKALLERAPFVLSDIYHDLNFEIEGGYERMLFDKAKEELEYTSVQNVHREVVLDAENIDKKNIYKHNGEPKDMDEDDRCEFKRYKECINTKVRKGRKFMELDYMDLRAIKNRLKMTSLCELVALYREHEKNEGVVEFEELLQKSLCSTIRTNKFIERIKFIKELEIAYLTDNPINEFGYEKKEPVKNQRSLNKEATLNSTEDGSNRGSTSIYSFLPFWYVEILNTDDKNAKLLQKMLGLTPTIATKIFKITSAKTLNGLINYFRENEKQNHNKILTPKQLKLLVLAGWSIQLGEKFDSIISTLSEDALTVPKFLFRYAKPQPGLSLLQIEDIKGLPISAYSAIVTSCLVQGYNLKGIRLSNLDLTSDIILVLQFLINSKNNRIVEITINHNDLKDEGAFTLLGLSRLESINTVRIIKLDDCRISSQGSIYLSGFLREAPFLQNNMKLQMLSLEDNNIGKSGFDTIFFSLRTNTTLKYLNLSKNKASDIDLGIVFDTFRLNKTLQVLHLNGNRINDSSVQQLLSETSKFTNITLIILKLGLIKTTSEHMAKMITEVLPSFHSLRYCEIVSLSVIKDDKKRIPKAVESFPHPALLKIIPEELHPTINSLADLITEFTLESAEKEAKNKVQPLPSSRSRHSLQAFQEESQSLPSELDNIVVNIANNFYGSATCECVCYLLEAHIRYDAVLKEGDTFLHRMAMHHQDEIVGYILKINADPDIRTKLTFTDFPNATLLHIAVASRSLALIGLAILNGADLNAKDANENTPMHYAASLGQLELCSFLLEHGCSLEIRNKKKMTPLHASILSNDEEILEYFIEHINTSKDPKMNKKILESLAGIGMNSLHIAIENDSERIVDYIIKQGINLDLTDSFKRNALQIAMEFDREEMVDVLLQKNIDINNRDVYGQTPLFYAVKNGNLELAEKMYTLGANIHTETVKGDTLLHAAAANGNIELIYWLIGKGINQGMKNLFGQLPRDLAKSKAVKDILPIVTEMPKFDIYSMDPTFGKAAKPKNQSGYPASLRSSSRPITYSESWEDPDLDSEEEEDDDEENFSQSNSRLTDSLKRRKTSNVSTQNKKLSTLERLARSSRRSQREDTEDEPYAKLSGTGRKQTTGYSNLSLLSRGSGKTPLKHTEGTQKTKEKHSRSFHDGTESGYDEGQMNQKKNIGNKSFIDERGSTPIKNSLPVIRKLSHVNTRENGEANSQGRTNSYMSYLQEIASKGQGEQEVRNQKLPKMNNKNHN